MTAPQLSVTDPPGDMLAIFTTWVAYQSGIYAARMELAMESATLVRENGNDRALGLALTYLGTVAFDRGDFPTTNRNFEETEPLVRASSDKWNLATTLAWYAHGLWEQGESQRALRLGKEALTLFRVVGEKWAVAWALHNLGYVARAQGDYAQARRGLVLESSRDLSDANLKGLGFFFQ